MQSREYLIAEGLRTLLVPLLLATGVAAFVFFTFRDPSPPPSGPLGDFEGNFQEWRHTEAGRKALLEWWRRLPSERPGASSEDWLRRRFARKTSAEKAERKDATEPDAEGPTKHKFRVKLRPFFSKLVARLWKLRANRRARAAGIVTLAAIVLYLERNIHTMDVIAILAITVGAVATLWLGISRAQTRRGAAAIFFATAALWSGGYEFLQTDGQRHPKLDLALVELKNEKIKVVGYFVARTNGDVYLAEYVPQTPKDGTQFRVRMFPKEDVVTFSFGPENSVGKDDSSATLCAMFGTTCGPPSPSGP